MEGLEIIEAEVVDLGIEELGYLFNGAVKSEQEGILVVLCVDERWEGEEAGNVTQHVGLEERERVREGSFLVEEVHWGFLSHSVSDESSMIMVHRGES